jgi:hypothetical protein
MLPDREAELAAGGVCAELLAFVLFRIYQPVRAARE